MRTLLWLLTLAALAVGLALAARYNDGYVLLVLPPWRAELSLNLMILLQLIGFTLCYLSLRIVLHTLHLPQAVSEFRVRRRREQAERALADAIRYSYEGRYGHALNSAERAYEADYAPALAALVAARAAHDLRDGEREEKWLQCALQHENDQSASRNARLMTEAMLHLDAHRYADASSTLSLLSAGGQRHIASLRLALRAHRALGDWPEVLRLVRQLQKHRALSAEQAVPLRQRAHQETLRSLSLDAGALASYWRELPEAERHSPRLAGEAARLLIALGDCLNAQRIIEEALEEEWDSSLAAVYAECRDGDVLGRIAQAEDWLKQHPRDAQLLLALGRLCRQQQLWGKARSYLEASLSVAVSRTAHVELAGLLDQLDHPDEANQHYRAAAEF